VYKVFDLREENVRECYVCSRMPTAILPYRCKGATSFLSSICLCWIQTLSSRVKVEFQYVLAFIGFQVVMKVEKHNAPLSLPCSMYVESSMMAV
jgi:hypothetical protein